MYSGKPSIEVIDAIRDAADEPTRVRRMPLGLLLDSVALADAGWRSVTVSRGSLRVAASRAHAGGFARARCAAMESPGRRVCSPARRRRWRDEPAHSRRGDVARARDDPVRAARHVDHRGGRARLSAARAGLDLDVHGRSSSIVLALIGELLEFSLTAKYTRKYGGSRRASWGAIIGGMIGAFIGVPVPIVGPVLGAFAGAFVGAFVGEYSRGGRGGDGDARRDGGADRARRRGGDEGRDRRRDGGAGSCSRRWSDVTRRSPARQATGSRTAGLASRSGTMVGLWPRRTSLVADARMRAACTTVPANAGDAMTRNGTDRRGATGQMRMEQDDDERGALARRRCDDRRAVAIPAHAQFGRLKKLKEKFSAPDSAARAKDSLEQIAAGVKPESVKVGKSMLQKGAAIVSTANGALESATGISAKDAALAATGVGASNLMAKKLGLDPMSIGAQALANAKMSAQQRAMQKAGWRRTHVAPRALGGMAGAGMQADAASAAMQRAATARANRAAMANADGGQPGDGRAIRRPTSTRSSPSSRR